MKSSKFGKLGMLLSFVLAFVLVFSLTACGDKERGDGDKLTLDKTSVTVFVLGAADIITVTSATTETVTWTIDKPDVATILASGVGNKLCAVAGLKEGTAVITATAGSKSATCNVTVTPFSFGGGEDGDGDNDGDGDEVVSYGVTIKLNGAEVSGLQNVHLGDNLTFTAETEAGSVNWESSDTSVATVSNGTVTAVKAGETTITAKVSDTAYASVKVKVVAPTNVNFGAEAAFANGWRYWAGDGDAAISSCVTYADNNDLKITYTMTAGQFYSVQLFFKDRTANKDHAVSLTVVSPVEAGITINGEAKTLVVGENDITVESFTGSTVSVQFGVSGTNTILGTDLTFEFKNINVTTPKAEAFLVAPTFVYDNDTAIINITDNDNDSEDVTRYELGFFANADDVETVAVVSVADGKEVNLDSVTTGTYTVRIRAVSDSATVINSEWSETSVSIDWENEKTPIGTEAPADTWYYYAHTDNTSVEQAYVDAHGNVHLVNVTGNTAETWSFQLKYDSSRTITAITMKVRATKAGAVGINLGNKDFYLTQVEGEDYYEVEISVTCNGTSLIICLGTNQESYGDKTNNLTGDIVFSDIVFTYAD